MITVYVTNITKGENRTPYQLQIGVGEELFVTAELNYTSAGTLTRVGGEVIHPSTMLNDGESLIYKEYIKGNNVVRDVRIVVINSGFATLQGVMFPPSRSVRELVDATAGIPDTSGKTVKDYVNNLLSLSGQKVTVTIGGANASGLDAQVTGNEPGSSYISIIISQMTKGN